MASRRSMTRQIHESIRLVLGKNVKILLKAPMKHELKGGEKTENRILVFTPHRMFIMTAKVPSRIDHHVHYLDMCHVDSKRSNHISFTFVTNGDKTATYSFRPNEDMSPNPDTAVDDMIVVLVTAVKRIYPSVPLEHIIGKLELKPVDHRLVNHAIWNKPDPKLIGPCGGFSAQYASMCDYYSLPFREEVAWDVDTIYYSHDSHDMCLQDFEHLDHRDLLCIISSLEHNTWFHKLKASGNVKLSADICERIVQVFSKSISMQELHVANIGARWELASKFGQAIAQNKSSSMTSFDMSCNLIEDKGVNQLSSVIAKHQKGLKHINLSYCSIGPKGLGNFANALSANSLNLATLTYLNLAGNTLKEDSHALCSFLAQPNVIAILDISSTETPIDALFGALVRGCTVSLTHLNLSRNPFSSSKKAKEVPSTFKQFFATTLVLQYLNMSHCKLPSESVKHLLLGLACNEATSNVELNLSCNNLGAAGANVLESCIGGVKCISRLDLSDNNIEAEMAGVMQGIMKNKSLLSLNVSRNMCNIKTKHMPAVMDSIVQVIQDEETVLQKLNLTDCKLKAEINNVINALGSNQSLQHLDITGNLMGDVGARLLAKALQINARLRIINLDRNAITLQGYTDLTYALQSNYSMRHIPFPTFDMQPIVKTHPERVDAIVHRMQELLQRNSNPQRLRNTSKAFRLTQGFLLSSTQQILDRVAAQTQDNIDALVKLNPDKASQEEVVGAKKLIQEADNSKHLLSALHDTTAKATDIDLKLKQVSIDLSNFLASHVQKNVEAMLSCAERQCPQVLGQKEGKCKSEIRAMCQKKCEFPTDFVYNLIMDNLGQEVHNKVNEMNLVIANHVSDRVIDEVIEGLGTKSKQIVSEAGSLCKKRSLTPDVLTSKARSSSLSESLEQETLSTASTDATSQKSESSPLNTPQTSKRISIHGRKLRPKSISDDVKDVKDAVKDATEQGSGDPKDSEDQVPELPSSAVLQHLGKARPKRAKKFAPTRGAVVQRSPSTTNESMENDEGLQKFYSSPGSPATSTPVDPPTSDIGGGDHSAQHTPTSGSGSGSGAAKKNIKEPKSLFLSKKVTTSPDTERKSPLCSLKSEVKASESSGKSDSPEKRALSPSLHSLSDIFAKKSSGESPGGATSSPSGISPFASRKLDSEILKRKSLGPGEEDKTLSPDLEGKRTPDGGVVKRHGIGHGGNPNLMAEMREKRASMVTKVSADGGELSPSRSTNLPPGGSEESGSKGIFSHVKLRSTGLAANLASPTNEYAGKPEDSSEDIKGSIVGLKAFSSSSSGSNPSPKEPSESSTSGSIVNSAKPKPLPKPRPWSIVGVDRKSGEMTSVGASSESSSGSSASSSTEEAKKSSGSSGSTATTTSTTENSSLSGSAPIPAARKSSVRDMINNMNKTGSTESTPTDGFIRKKGSSLPRGVNPPGASNPATDEGAGGLKSGSSPKVTKRSESTTDDPRILKLDDDFAYDDVMEV